jgi:hypothetical protein
MAKVEINSPAPEFALQDFHGNRVELGQFREDKHVLLIMNRGFK